MLIGLYLTIVELYDQQKFMYDNKVKRVENGIVSISQPYIRPIVRGKVKTPTEIGAKYDVSVDENGHARLEKYSWIRSIVQEITEIIVKNEG